jgi:3,4-dihydroxy 2-butanone 4-phosphate synthase/GTP cyclohydrolase II
MSLNPIQDIIADIKAGRMVILVDEEDRENEGDLVLAAEHVTPEAVNFMVKHARGLVCLTLTGERCQQLGLSMMVANNQTPHGTAFTVSIEAAEGVTTGISAHDRARTVQAAAAKNARPSDIIQPGHVFPLRAQEGGVLVRAGHTEAGCDLAALSGLEPAAVICEIMNEDGTMARQPQLVEFAREHGLKMGTIADLIRHRMENESSVQRVSDCVLSTQFGEFRVIGYHDDIGDAVHLALVKGEVRNDRPMLVRVHVQESMLDLFTDAHRSPGTWTLQRALARVAQEGSGVVVILQQEERSSDLVRRLRHFQTRANTLELPPRREGREEMRTYGLGSQILADLGVSRMRVLGHAMKAPGLSGFGLEIVEYLEAEPAAVSTPNKEKKAS